MTLSLDDRLPQIVPSPVSPNVESENGAPVPSALAFTKIDQMIEQLATVGALDEGNKRALDGVIDSWRAQHREAMTAFHIDRAGDREERIQVFRRKIELTRQRLARAQKHLASLDDDGPLTTEVAP